MSTGIAINHEENYKEAFEPETLPHRPNAETIAAIEAAERGEDMYGPFYTVKELMEALDADD